MSSSHHPLRVNVGFLINQAIGTHREISFDVSDVHLDEELEFQHLTGTIRFSRATQGILMQCHFETETEMQCVRCLKDYNQLLQTDFDELYSFPNYPPGESGLILPDSGNIDLRPLLREYLLLEFPSKPLCKPDCLGLCQVCGADLNRTICVHKKSQIKKGTSEEASRWGALRNIQLDE